jgi:hypothetical protein
VLALLGVVDRETEHRHQDEEQGEQTEIHQQQTAVSQPRPHAPHPRAATTRPGLPAMLAAVGCPGVGPSQASVWSVVRTRTGVRGPQPGRVQHQDYTKEC